MLIVSAAIGLAGIEPAGARQQAYIIIDLGPFVGFNASDARAVNESGRVVGYSANFVSLDRLEPGEPARGVVWADINGDCVTDFFDLTLLLTAWGSCPCGGQGAQGGGGGGSGPEALGPVLALMGFGDVDDYQGHISATTESEAFVCACVLEVLLFTQP